MSVLKRHNFSFYSTGFDGTKRVLNIGEMIKHFLPVMVNAGECLYKPRCDIDLELDIHVHVLKCMLLNVQPLQWVFVKENIKVLDKSMKM